MRVNIYPLCVICHSSIFLVSFVKPIVVKKRDGQEAKLEGSQPKLSEEERKLRLEAQRRAREEKLVRAKELTAQRRQVTYC